MFHSWFTGIDKEENKRHTETEEVTRSERANVCCASRVLVHCVKIIIIAFIVCALRSNQSNDKNGETTTTIARPNPLYTQRIQWMCIELFRTIAIYQKSNIEQFTFVHEISIKIKCSYWHRTVRRRRQRRTEKNIVHCDDAVVSVRLTMSCLWSSSLRKKRDSCDSMLLLHSTESTRINSNVFYCCGLNDDDVVVGSRREH